MSRDAFIRASFGELLESRDERLPNNGTHPLYSLTIKDGVTPKTDRYEREFLVTNKEGKKYKIIRTGDLVFNPSNLRWGSIATSLIPFPVLASPIYEIFYPKDNKILDPYFLGALASSPMLMAKYLSLVEGTLVERTALKKDDFLDIEIELPPLPEQKKIAEILSGIDRNLASLHLYASKLRLARDEVITSFFHEASKSGEFKEIRSFGEIVTGSTPPTSNPLNYVGAIPFITPGDLSDSGGVIAGTKSSLSAVGATISRIIPPSSVCVVCIGSTIGKAALTKTESATNQQINTLLPGNYDPFFMLAAISHFRNEIRNSASTHAVPIINKRRFGEIAIPKPDLDHQRKFGDYISSSHNTLSHIMKKIQKYQQLKVAVASDLLSGRKRVTL